MTTRKIYNRSGWYKIDVCSSCEKRLKDHAKMYSGGVCPKCGHSTKGTICSTSTVVIQEIRYSPLWRFWNREFEYIGRNDFSTKWIENN